MTDYNDKTLKEDLRDRLKHINDQDQDNLPVLEAIGFSDGEFRKINTLVSNVADLMLFKFNKITRENRKPTEEGGDTAQVHMGKLLLQTLTSEEGDALVDFLDDHIHTNTMKYYVLAQVLYEFLDNLHPSCKVV